MNKSEEDHSPDGCSQEEVRMRSYTKKTLRLVTKQTREPGHFNSCYSLEVRRPYAVAHPPFQV